MTLATERVRVGRLPFTALQLQLDYCQLSYGVSPCDAGRVHSATATAGGANTITLAASASSTDNEYLRHAVVIIAGTGVGQERVISAYNGTSKIATVSQNWTTIPDATSSYDIVDRPNACYNTRATCQAPTAYVDNILRTTHEIWLTTPTQDFPLNLLNTSGVAVAIPCLRDVRETPGNIEISGGLGKRAALTATCDDFPHHDRGLDKYVASRSYTAQSQGTFWGKFMARHRYYQGRPLIRHSGYLVDGLYDAANFETRYYILERFEGPDRDNRMRITAKDILKLADDKRAVVPAPSTATLVEGTVETGTAQAGATNTITLMSTTPGNADSYINYTLTLTGGTGSGQERTITAYNNSTKIATVDSDWTTIPDNTTTYTITLQGLPSTATVKLYLGPDTSYDDEYPAIDSYVRIGSEIIKYANRVAGNRLEGLTRAQFNTVADDHDIGATAQYCIHYDALNVVTIVQYLLDSTYRAAAYFGYTRNAGIDAAKLDLAGWATEQADWLSFNNLTTLLTEPIGVNTLLSELTAQNLFYLWWDPVDQLIKMRAISPLTTSVALTDDDHFVADTILAKDDPAQRVSEVWVYYDTVDYTDTGTDNFQQLYIQIDGLNPDNAESESKYDEVRVKEFQSRWIVDQGRATQLAGRTLALFKDNPRTLRFQLDAKDDVQLGDYVSVQTRQLQDDDGSSLALNVIILERHEALEGSAYEYLAQEFNFVGRYGFIGPDGLPDYGADALLLETGDLVLKEDGGYILLETATAAGATEDQKNRYAWIALDTGFFADGTEAYKIL